MKRYYDDFGLYEARDGEGNWVSFEEAWAEIASRDKRIAELEEALADVTVCPPDRSSGEE